MRLKLRTSDRKEKKTTSHYQTALSLVRWTSGYSSTIISRAHQQYGAHGYFICRHRTVAVVNTLILLLSELLARWVMHEIHTSAKTSSYYTMTEVKTYTQCTQTHTQFAPHTAIPIRQYIDKLSFGVWAKIAEHLCCSGTKRHGEIMSTAKEM